MKITLREFGTYIPSYDKGFLGDVFCSRLEGLFCAKGKVYSLTVQSVPTFRRNRKTNSRFYPSLMKPVRMSSHNGLHVSIFETKGHAAYRTYSITRNTWDYEPSNYTKEMLMWELNLNLNLSGKDRITEIEMEPGIVISRGLPLSNKGDLENE